MDCKNEAQKEAQKLLEELQGIIGDVSNQLTDAIKKLDEQCDELPFDLEKESVAAWACNLVLTPLAWAEFNIKTEVVKDYFATKNKPVTEEVAIRIARMIVEPISRIDSKVIEEGYALVKSREITFNF